MERVVGKAPDDLHEEPCLHGAEGRAVYGEKDPILVAIDVEVVRQDHDVQRLVWGDCRLLDGVQKATLCLERGLIVERARQHRVPAQHGREEEPDFGAFAAAANAPEACSSLHN
jgi:hypothetical protein